MDTSSSRASTAAGGARRTTDSAAFSAVSDTLGVDPLADLELAWLVQDFLDAPLPGSWRRLVTPAGQTQYVHIGLNRATPVHPALKRYKALVAYCKDCKRRMLPVDELTVIELLNPVEDPREVRSLASYLGIDPKREAHLAWIAKLGVLQRLPPFWTETVTPRGEVYYACAQADISRQAEHPMDAHLRALLARERGKPSPKESCVSEQYSAPVVRYIRSDQKAGKDGKVEVLSTRVIPALGSHVPFYDADGEVYYFDMVSGAATRDLTSLKVVPAVVIIQRVVRGWRARRQLRAKHDKAMLIGRWWRAQRFRRVMRKVMAERDAAAELFSQLWEKRRRRIAYGRELALALLTRGGAFTREQAERMALPNCGKSFSGIRSRVITLQRGVRAMRQHRVAKVAEAARKQAASQHTSLNKPLPPRKNVQPRYMNWNKGQQKSATGAAVTAKRGTDAGLDLPSVPSAPPRRSRAPEKAEEEETREAVPA